MFRKMLGLAIKEARLELGLSQAKAGAAMGKDWRWMERRENGRTKISIEDLDLMEAWGLNPERVTARARLLHSEAKADARGAA